MKNKTENEAIRIKYTYNNLNGPFANYHSQTKLRKGNVLTVTAPDRYNCLFEPGLLDNTH